MCMDETTRKLEQELLDKVTEGTNEPASTQDFTVWEDPRGFDPGTV